MEKRTGIFLLIIFLSFVIFTFISLRINLTGNVISEVQENFKINDSFSGIIRIDNTNTLRGDSLMLFSLIKNDSVLKVETLNFKNLEIIKQGNYYLVKIETVLNHTFSEEGEYTFIFSMPDQNIHIKRDFSVETFKSNL